MSTNVYNPSTGDTAYVIPGQALPKGYVPNTPAMNDGIKGTSIDYYSPVNTANAAHPYGIDATTGQPSYAPTGPAVPTPYVAASKPDISKPTDASAIANGPTPLNIPSASPSTDPAAPIIAGAQASQDTAETQAEKNVANENAGVDASQAKSQDFLGSVKSLLGMESDAQTARATGADQQNIDAANKDLTGINTQIADTNVKLRGVLDQIKGRGDISQSAQQGLMDNANAQYGRTLADLAIRQSAANMNIEALTKAADEKLALILAPLQTQLSYYKDFALQNQDNLTKAEQTKVSQIIAEKQNIITQTQTQETAKTDLLKTALTNGVKLTDAQTQGVLNAPDAASAAAYLASQGVNLQANAFTAVTNPITGAQTSFNTKTGQFGASTGGTPSPGGTKVDSTIATDAKGNNPTTGQPPISAPIVNGVRQLTGNSLIDTAQQMVDGDVAPSSIKGRGIQSNQYLAYANRLSLEQTGKPFDASASEAAFKFRQSPTYQKFITNAPTAISTINTIVEDAKKLNLTGPDLFNNLSLKAKASGFDPFATQDDRATAKELVNTLSSISADDIGLLLGSGSGSDYKTKLGSAIFDVNGNLQTTEQIAKTVQDRIQSKLDTYYKVAGVNDPSIYSTKDSQQLTGSLAGANQTSQNPVPKEGDTHVWNGVTYKVVNGNWTAQ